MAPGEEQRVQVPVDAGQGASLLRIEASSGFRPSEREPASRDQRFLGVWVKSRGVSEQFSLFPVCLLP